MTVIHWKGNDALLAHRENIFLERVGVSFSGMFSHLVAGNKNPFEQAVLYYVSITKELSPYFYFHGDEGGARV